MAITVFFIVALQLLFIPPQLTAAVWAEFPSWKFLLNLFTYQLDHNNLQHLLGNYMFMVPYAVYLQYKVGAWRFIYLYFTAGVVAALGQWLAVPFSPGIIGSSGSAFGVFTAATLLFSQQPHKRMEGSLWIGLALAMQIFYVTRFGGGGVGYWAHICGALTGLVIGAFWCAELNVSRRKRR